MLTPQNLRTSHAIQMSYLNKQKLCLAVMLVPNFLLFHRLLTQSIFTFCYLPRYGSTWFWDTFSSTLNFQHFTGKPTILLLNLFKAFPEPNPKQSTFSIFLLQPLGEKNKGHIPWQLVKFKGAYYMQKLNRILSLYKWPNANYLTFLFFFF